MRLLLVSGPTSPPAALSSKHTGAPAAVGCHATTGERLAAEYKPPAQSYVQLSIPAAHWVRVPLTVPVPDTVNVHDPVGVVDRVHPPKIAPVVVSFTPASVFCVRSKTRVEVEHVLNVAVPLVSFQPGAIAVALAVAPTATRVVCADDVNRVAPEAPPAPTPAIADAARTDPTRDLGMRMNNSFSMPEDQPVRARDRRSSPGPVET
jgi:hypothetical protein